ncbi:Hypothetical_protein [Hexamita inflata]|uniref:Hypothetical_protein n=1 Tax=Hexamita inflata TaxID=28002 RepID=A0AA86N9Q9_9EUKA|nr:Hypothetical protein HINF_LOCUS2901 [Hexamita inflata]
MQSTSLFQGMPLFYQLFNFANTPDCKQFGVLTEVQNHQMQILKHKNINSQQLHQGDLHNVNYRVNSVLNNAEIVVEMCLIRVNPYYHLGSNRMLARLNSFFEMTNTLY